MRRTVIALLFLLHACVANAPSDTSLRISDSSEVAVDRVSDGDSFIAGDLEVRLLDVNAPESDECFGQESRDWLRSSIEGESVEIVVVDIDQFGRSLGDVHLGERWINYDIVATGHALTMSTALDELKVAEENAMKTGTGLWGEAICGADSSKALVEIVALEFNPPGDDSEEKVTIRNLGAGGLALKGFTLRDESSVNRFNFPEVTIGEGEEIVVSTSCRGSPEVLYWCTGDPVWNNGGDTALLLDSVGRVVAVYRYP